MQGCVRLGRGGEMFAGALDWFTDRHVLKWQGRVRPLNKPSLGVKNTTSVKAAWFFSHIFILAGSRRRRGKPLLKSPVTSCDTWWCKDQQWNCLFSSLRLRLHIIPGLKRATLHQLAGRQLTFTWRWHSACFLCSFVKKEKSLIRKPNYRGRRSQTEGRRQIIRRTEGWLDKQGQTCCLAASRSCSGGGDAGRTWY